MKVYKKWIYSFIFIFSVLATLISFFNYKVDGLGLYGNSNFLSKAATLIADGKMVAGLKDHDERLFQEILIKKFKNHPDAIVIGSSTSMQLRSSYIEKNRQFYNHSVSGASLEDYISIIGVYEKHHNAIPSTVILGIDPWIFNKNNNQNRWKTLRKYYNFIVNKIDKRAVVKSDPASEVWLQLINYDVTINNLRLYADENQDGVGFYETDNLYIDDNIKDVDGSIYYPFSIRFPNHEKMNEEIRRDYTNHKTYALTRFDKISNSQLFEKFVKYLHHKNIRVIIVLPPYHPIAYDALFKDKRYNSIWKVEQYLRGLSKKGIFQLYGSFNPYESGLTYVDFFDAIHSNGDSLEKKGYYSEIDLF
jgi:hypothetical protein